MEGGLAQWFKRHAPSWLASLALHAAILGPLCLITWAVSTSTHKDQVLTLAPVESIMGGQGDAGDEGQSDRFGDNSGGAAGAGSDRLADQGRGAG